MRDDTSQSSSMQATRGQRTFSQELAALLESVNEMKSLLGRSEDGRRVAILATKVEDCLAWSNYALPAEAETNRG